MKLKSRVVGNKPYGTTFHKASRWREIKTSQLEIVFHGWLYSVTLCCYLFIYTKSMAFCNMTIGKTTAELLLRNQADGPSVYTTAAG